ncbi:hypothetical protein AURDEDRAFT_111412 [Auricularia subglabra TFB-10046 SS5]|nr:hypothetical protein AURDEDRAFT_111412 [Auricularia subglabra TFB-10046 SS5]
MSTDHARSSAGPVRPERRSRQTAASTVMYRLVRPARIVPPTQPRRILGEIEWWKVVSGQEPEPSYDATTLVVEHFRHHVVAPELSSPPPSPLTATPRDDDSDDSRSPPSTPISPSHDQSFAFQTRN